VAKILEEGAPLVHLLTGFGKLAVAGYVGGGFAALDAIVRTAWTWHQAHPRGYGA